MPTILGLPEPCLEIIQAQVGHLVFDVVQIHCAKSKRDNRESRLSPEGDSSDDDGLVTSEVRGLTPYAAKLSIWAN